MQAPQSRRLAENVVPNTAVPGLVPPPNTVFHSFSPCGRYLIAFQPVTSEVVAFRFKGLHWASGAAGTPPTAAPQSQTAGQQAAVQPQPQVRTGQRQQQQEQLQGHPQGQQAEDLQEHAVAFGDIFEEHWRCCPCPGRQEQISPEFCAGVSVQERAVEQGADTSAVCQCVWMTGRVQPRVLQRSAALTQLCTLRWPPRVSARLFGNAMLHC